MDLLADASSTPERKSIIDTALPHAASVLVLPAIAILVLNGIARISDPNYGSVPLRDSEGRSYYVAALMFVAVLIVGESTTRGSKRQELVAVAAGNTLLIGAATMLFVGHRDAVVLVAMLAVAVACGWSRVRSSVQVLAHNQVLASKLLTAPLIWIIVFGLLEFHLRWLYAIPLAFIAGVASLISIERADRHRSSEVLLGSIVVGLALAQLIVATSFLNAHSRIGATLVCVSLAAVLGVRTVTVKHTQT